MKYMIHTYPKRIWYVNKYLVPDLLKMGIKAKDIIIFEDKHKRGNLQAFLDSLDYIYNNLSEEEGLWHLQDDVIICKDFKKLSQNIDTSIVNNAFVSKTYANLEKTGLQNVKDYWYSFPCVYIPNRYIGEFMGFMLHAKESLAYKRRYDSGRYDDYFFYKFLKIYYPQDKMMNLNPNLVDHIDYLLGGTTGTRRNMQVRAYYFIDTDKVKELERNIRNDK